MKDTGMITVTYKDGSQIAMANWRELYATYYTSAYPYPNRLLLHDQSRNEYWMLVINKNAAKITREQYLSLL